MLNSQSRIFFSYSRSDSNFVLKVARALRSEGRSVWVDQLDIPKGARWDEEVEKALKASNCLLVVLSPASTNSQNVLDEVSFALDEGRKVLPILLQQTSIPFRLKRLQYIDFTADFDDGYKQLCAALDSLPPSGGTVSPGSPAPGVAVPVEAPAPAPAPVAAAAAAPVAAPTYAAPAAPAADTATRPRSMAAILMMLSLVLLLLLGGAYWLYVTKASQPVESPAQRPSISVEVPPPANPPVGLATTTPPVSLPAVTPQPANSVAPPSPAVGDQQLVAFVDDYIRAQNRSNAIALLEFYGERIDYFDRAGVDREVVLKDKQVFYRRWPETANRRIGEVRIDRVPGEPAARVSYLTEYRVHSPERSDSREGQARELLTLRFEDGRIRIVAQRQEIIGSSTQGKKG